MTEFYFTGIPSYLQSGTDQQYPGDCLLYSSGAMGCLNYLFTLRG